MVPLLNYFLLLHAKTQRSKKKQKMVCFFNIIKSLECFKKVNDSIILENFYYNSKSEGRLAPPPGIGCMKRRKPYPFYLP